MLTRSSVCDHDQLCGLTNIPSVGQMYLKNLKTSWNAKPLNLKELGYLPLQSNKSGNPQTLNNPARKLQKQLKKFEQNYQVTQTQLSEGIIIKKTTKRAKGTKLYTSHILVIRDDAERTDIIITYDNLQI